VEARLAICIEDVASKQLDELYAIERKCFKKEAFSKQQIAFLIGDYNSISLVAKEEDRIVGFIIATMAINNRTMSGHILTLDVNPADQKRGIGTRLLGEIESTFSRKGAKFSELEAREDNDAAIQLYKDFGYKKVRRLVNYYGNADGIYLKKSLR